MARALLGYVGTGTDPVLAMEVARLRKRVAELETELAALREGPHGELDHDELDLELHHIASATAPALT
jgi:hypothetical protein